MLVSLKPEEVKQAPRIVGIYCITQESTGKAYVGMAFDIRARWSSHVCDLKAKRHTNMLLQKAWNFSSSSDFQFHILEIVHQSNNLRERENRWIALLSAAENINGFNIVSRSQNPSSKKAPSAYRPRLTPEKKQAIKARIMGKDGSERRSHKLIAADFDIDITTVSKLVRELERDRYFLTAIRGYFDLTPARAKTPEENDEPEPAERIAQPTKSPEARLPPTREGAAEGQD